MKKVTINKDGHWEFGEERNIIMKYRSKPVEIEAIQWDGKNLDEIINFVGNNLGPIERRPDYKLKIKTLESGHGYHEVDKFDYIIKGLIGEFYPCKPEVFYKKYEAIDGK